MNHFGDSACRFHVGSNGTADDVAIIQRPKKAPLLIAADFTGSSASAAERDNVLAEVGRIVTRRIGGP